MFSMTELHPSDIRHSKAEPFPEVIIFMNGQALERVTGPTAKIKAKDRIAQLSFDGGKHV